MSFYIHEARRQIILKCFLFDRTCYNYKNKKDKRIENERR